MAQDTQSTSGASGASSSRNRRLSDCFERGLHLSNCDQNYDYAHAMFAECVRHEPGSFQFVEAMIRNLRARSPSAKKRPFKLGRRGARTLKTAIQRKEWTEVFTAGVELLNADPWEVTTLRALAEASAARHYNEVELVYFKQALDAEPTNVEVNRHCARSLGRMGQFDQAIACWHRIEKLRGKDDEAAKMISLLAEEKLKYPGGRPPAARSKAALAEEPEVKETPQEIVLSPRQKLEQAIEQEPQKVANYLELAELLLESSQFNAAETVLVRGLAACGEQHELVEQLRRVRMLRADEQRELAEERAMQQEIENAPFRIPWLELALIAMVLMLALQLIPAFRAAAWRLVDFRQWSQLGWIAFNIIVLIALVAVRFAPDLLVYSRERQKRRRRRTARRIR